eukprot:1158731-Pelagomonas_calceolata.AAC.1
MQVGIEKSHWPETSLLDLSGGMQCSGLVYLHAQHWVRKQVENVEPGSVKRSKSRVDRIPHTVAALMYCETDLLRGPKMFSLIFLQTLWACEACQKNSKVANFCVFASHTHWLLVFTHPFLQIFISKSLKSPLPSPVPALPAPPASLL